MTSQKEARLCCMCGSSPYKDPSITLHRFPKPGFKNALRCELWAKYCFPNEAWSSPKFQDKLHSGHKMLCSKHFKSKCFIEKKLFRTAVPDVQYHKMPLRWGIITAGKISNDFVNALNSYPDNDDQVVVAVAARDKTRAKEFAKLHSIEKVFNSYQELAESKEIDVVYIGALISDHYPLTKLCLDNGKHVLCEKAFTLNAKQTQSLINLAKKKNLFLMEAIWTRFCPAYVDLEKYIESGKLGEIRFVEAVFGIDVDAERLFKKELGGGAILDVGIYLLNLSQYVFKEEPIKVTAIGDINENGVDVAETIVLDYSGGRRSVVTTHTKQELCNKATIYGTKGRITLEDPFHTPTKVTLPDGTTKEYSLHTSNLPYVFVNSAALVYEALEVARCIRAGLIESPRMSHQHSVTLAKLMDTVRKQIGVHYDADDQEYP